MTRAPFILEVEVPSPDYSDETPWTKKDYYVFKINPHQIRNPLTGTIDDPEMDEEYFRLDDCLMKLSEENKIIGFKMFLSETPEMDGWELINELKRKYS